MPDRPPPNSPVLPQQAKALLDELSEGVVVCTVKGQLLYANRAAQEALQGVGGAALRARLAVLSGAGPATLAAQERETIVKTLDANDWKLAETAKHLGISRTTLWRRLKAYGIYRDGRTR